MADYKVIIRSEVNALVAGTYTSDLNKAVLYGDSEISGNPAFVISSINSASNTPYTATQALLEADIRIAASINVTLTPRQATINSSVTSVIFDITTAGTASIGTPVYTIVTATYDGGAPTSASINGTQLTITFPANTAYTSKEITARVKLAIDGNEFQSNLATVTQNAAGYLRFNPASNTIHSTGTTDTANYETNCTNIGVSARSGITNANVNTGNHTVALTFPMNTASTQTTRTITITGTTPDNTTISATYTITHQAALSTDMTFSYNGGDLSAASGTIPTSAFSITLTNASLNSASANNGMSVTTGGTVTAPTITVSYPANTAQTGTRTYTITLTAVDIYGRTITRTVNINQNNDAHSLSVAPDSASVQYHETTMGFDVVYVNVSNIGFCPSASSAGITGSVSGARATATFPQNTGGSSITYTFAVTGTSIAGTSVTATTSFTQTAASAASIQIIFTNDPVNADVTHNSFIVVTSGIDDSTLGWNQAGSSWVTACTVDGTNLTGSADFPANTMYTDNLVTVSVTGTSLLGETITGTSSFTQSKVIVTPQLAISYTGQTVGAASGSTNKFSITANYVTVTGYTVTSPATIGASGATSVTVNYPANTTESNRTFTVTVRGYDVYNVERTATCTFSQTGDTYTFTLTPNPLQRGAMDTNGVFIVNSTNISSIGVSGYTGAITNATYNSGSLTVQFPTNPGDVSREMTVTLSGRTVGGRTVTVTGTVAQAAGGDANLSISYNGSAMPSSGGTTDDFTITANNVTVTGYSASNGASIVDSGTSSVEVSIPQNTSTSSTSYTITVYGTNDFNGNQVSASTTVTQSGKSTLTLSASPNSVGFTGGTVTFSGTYANVTESTIGRHSSSSNVPTYSSITKGSGSLTFTGDIPFNTGSSRNITVIVSATTPASATITASTVVSQDAFPSSEPDTYFISVTPDGTSITPSSQTVTYTVTWKYLKVGEQITFTKGTGLSGTASAINITSANFMGSSTTISLTATGNSGSSSRNLYLTGSTVDAAGQARSDRGYYTQAKSNSMFTFENDFSVAWDVTSATITFTYAYLTNNSVSLAATGGAYFNSTLSQPSTSVNITPNASSRTGSVTIYFSKNDGVDPETYTITATGNIGQAGESKNDTITITHNSAAGAYIILTDCATTYYWDSQGTTLNLDWANIKGNPGITITANSGNVTITPSSFVNMNNGDQDVQVSFPANTGSTPITYTITATGQAIAGSGTITKTVDITIPAMPAASLSITPTNGSVASTATTATFTVTWTNLKPNSNISFSKSSTITGSTPDTGISITSANAGSGSQSVTIRFSQNSGSSSRNLTLTGTAQNLNSSAITATGKYVQSEASTSYQNIKFNTSVGSGSVTSLSLDASETSSYHYAVEEKYINGTFDSYYNDTSSASYVLYSGTSANNCNTSVGSFSYSSGQMYSDAYLTISGNGTGTSAKFNFVSDSTYTSARYYRLTATDDGDTAEMKITIAAYVPTYNPNIWWTKTNGGAESTAVSSVTDVPAYVSGTYDGRNVTYTIYVNYNSDVTGYTMNTSSLTGGATASKSGKTVTITAPVNSLTSTRSLGTISVTGTAPDGTTDTEILAITQVGGVSPSLVWTSNGQTGLTINDADTDKYDYTCAFTPSYVGDIAVSGTPDGSINTWQILSGNRLFISGGTAQSSTQYTWSTARVSGSTVYGDVVYIELNVRQDPLPVVGCEMVFNIVDVNGDPVTVPSFTYRYNVTNGDTRTNVSSVTINDSTEGASTGWGAGITLWYTAVTPSDLFITATGSVITEDGRTVTVVLQNNSPWIKIEGDTTHTASGETHIANQSQGFYFDITSLGIQSGTFGTGSTVGHTSEHSHIDTATASSSELAIFFDGRDLTSLGLGSATDYIDVTGTSIYGSTTVRATLVFTISLQKATITWTFSNAGIPSVPSNTSYELVVGGTSVTYPGGGATPVTYVAGSAYTVCVRANVQQTQQFDPQTVLINFLGDYNKISPTSFQLSLGLSNYGIYTSTTQNIVTQLSGSVSVSFNWQQTYVYSLTTTQAGCTVVMCGVTVTTNSIANHTYSMSSVDTSMNYEVSKSGYYTESGTITGPTREITVTLNEVVSTYETISMTNQTMWFRNATSSNITISLTIYLVRDSDDYTIGTWTQTGASTLAPGATTTVTPYFPSASSATALTNTSLSVQYGLTIASGSVSKATFQCAWNGTFPSVTGYVSGSGIHATCSLGTLSPHQSAPWPFPEGGFEITIS